MELFDKYGHCIITGECLYEDKAINGELKRVMKANSAHVSYLLVDGSLMRVMMSKQSKASLTNTDKENALVMKRVIAGWEYETSKLVKNKDKKDWTEEKKEEYMKEYSKKKILSRMDDIPIRSMQNIEREINKVKKRLLKESRDKLKKNKKS